MTTRREGVIGEETACIGILGEGWSLRGNAIEDRREGGRVFSCSRFGVATFTTCEAVKVHCGTARRARVCAGLKFSECERED